MLARPLLAASFGTCVLLPLASSQTPCSEFAEVESVGSGTPGATGTPSLDVFGWTGIGGPFAFQVRGGAPQAVGILFLGADVVPIPLAPYGAIAYPSLPLFSTPFLTGLDGQSNDLFALGAVPATLCGQQFVGQAVVVDGAAQGGFAFSQAQRVVFGAIESPRFTEELVPFAESGSGVAAADLDQDGRLDLLLRGPGGLSVRLGLGAGRFGPELSIALGAGSTGSVETGDIDGDGRPEVLVETQSELVLVSLQGSALVTVGTLPVDAAVDFEFGDVNQDGLLDVLAATGGQLLQITATGPGTFGPAEVVAPLQGQVVFELDDLDADGDLEVVLADDTRIGVLEPMPGGAPYGVVFTANHGLSAASSLAFGELTGDAQLDVVQRFGDDFRVWRGLGDGTLAAEGDFTMAAGTTDLVVLDVDLDGLDDVLVADSGEVFADPVDGALIARLGLPGGGLGQPIPYGDTLNSSRLALGDMDQDGVDEVLVAESFSPGVTLVRRDGSGGLAATPTTFLSMDIDGLATGDMNQDGLDDVVASGILFSSPRFGVFTSDGNGDVTQATTVALASSPSDVDLADLTSNGELDVVVSFEGLARIEVREGNGDGTVGAAQSYGTQTGIEDLTLADVNGDGRPDVLAVAGNTSEVSVLLGQSDGTLGSEARFAAGVGASRVAAGDFDNDGNQDLLVVQGAGPGDVVALVLAGDGAGNFVPTDQLSSPSLVAIDVEAGDVDGDGIDDVAVLCDAALLVFLSDGQGGFGPASAFEGIASTVNGDLELADVTGDGRADALHSSTAEDALVYYEARSEGALFNPRQLFRASLLSREVALGDLDGDGDLEALVGDPFTRFLFVFLQL